jgi:hypothetical protein
MSIHDRRWLGLAIGGLLLATAGSTPAFAQDPPAATAAAAQEPARVPADETVVLRNDGVVTPEAQAVLDRMKATLGGLTKFSLSAAISRDELLPYGYKLQNLESSQLWVERPNKLRLEVDGNVKKRTYVYDGSTLSIFAPDNNLYSTAKAPATLRELIVALLDAGVEMPLIDMLFNGVGGDLTDDVRVGLVVGESEIDGVMTDQLAFRQPDLDWQLWVQKGPQALPRKLLITTRYAVGDPQYQAVMKWDLNPRIAANAFTFTPPAGATKVPNQAKLVAEGGDK